MTQFRICIETLLPKQLRKPGASADEVIASQYPVSDWHDVLEWYDLMIHLRRSKPIVAFGLIYGQQKREDDAKVDVAAALKEIERDILDFYARKRAAEDARRIDTERRIDDFLK